jgi:hypothetical protein
VGPVVEVGAAVGVGVSVGGSGVAGERVGEACGLGEGEAAWKGGMKAGSEGEA